MLDVIDWLSNPVVAGLVSAGILAFISFAFGAPIRRWWSKVGPRLTAPRADLKSFSILVANLEGDDQLHSTRGLIESLERLSGVEVYRLEQSLPAWPAGSTREGRERTHLYVREILVKRHHFDIVLWGSVLRSHRGETLKLHVTSADGPFMVTDATLPDTFQLPHSLRELFENQIVIACTRHLKPDHGIRSAFNRRLFYPSIEKLKRLLAGAVSSGALSRTAIAELELQLGCSLRELGRYQLREELLTEALAAHERAAELSSPDTALAARTQLELGHTLLDLHRRWEEASFWERARTAFTTSAYLALPEHPELRAAALRGLAMSMYGSRDASQYREAVNLLQEAMETFTKDAYPFEFAATNQELARIHMYVGWLLQIPEWANEATHALTTALSILSEGETPFEWADANVQQAGIEYHRAEEHLAFEPSKQSLEHLERAATLCEDALRVYDPVREPLAWVTSNRILAKALTLKGAQVNDPSFLMRAVQILKDLADLDDLDQHRSAYILVHEARAVVALAAAGFLPSTDVLRDGIQSIGLALQRVSPTTHSFQWGNMKVIQGSLYFAVGGTVANIQQAVDSFAEAAEVYKASSEHRYRTRALQKYNEAQERLREYIRLTERYGTGA